jgi:hypothetical protein
VKRASNIDRFAVIIGAMKCGTTSLFRYLCQHPQVVGSSHKELNYFADDDNWARGNTWYEEHFDFDPARHRVGLEASTHYTKQPMYPNAAERMAQVDASFKLVYLVRDPVARIESHLTHGVFKGWLGERKHIKDHPHVLAVSRYAYQLDAFLEHFPADDILVVSLSELKQQPRAVVDRVLAHIGLDADFELNTDSQHNSSREKTVDRGLWRVLGKTGPLGQALPTGVRRFLGEGVERQVLSPDERAFVAGELADDMQRLRDEHGVDTDAWFADVEA